MEITQIFLLKIQYFQHGKHLSEKTKQNKIQQILFVKQFLKLNIRIYIDSMICSLNVITNIIVKIIMEMQKTNSIQL